MQKVAIVTDGSCDLPKELVEKYNLFVVPFQVIVGNRAFQMYGDYGTITKDEFYNLIDAAGELPTTSVPAPKSFYDTYCKAFEIADSVIAILLSQKLSSTYQNAHLVLNMLDKKDITLVDSRVASSTLGALVIEAAKLAQKGSTKKDILQHLEYLIPQARLAGIMDNVETTYRSGRIGWGKKFLVEALNIRPIVIFNGGEILSDGTIRGDREEILNRMKFLAPIVVEKAITDTIFIWHVRSPDNAEILRELMEEANYDNREIIVQEAGPVIGTHVGKGAIAYMYIGDYQKKWLTKMEK
ncbi:MAG: DegV family protein [Candidatus Thorarchaeota archaeon]